MEPIAELKPRPYRLVNTIQHYAWGTKDEDAFIPRLLGIEAEPGRPYAELWMGAHANAPSQVLVDGVSVSLGDLVAGRPREVLGREVAQAFAGTFPFLFKILSAGEPVSIQVHPNRVQARALHAADPAHYADDNHKPEVAIALDSLTALVGFKGFTGVRRAVVDYPELGSFVGRELVGALREAGEPPYPVQRRLVRHLYSTLVQRSLTEAEAMLAGLEQLERRLRASAGARKEEEQLFLDLRSQYPGADVGLFTLFLLNLVHLRQGQAVFIPAGVPHAYLRGNIVECMAASDNVVRAGLTDKFKDVQTLVEILTYELGPVEILAGRAEGGRVVYETPADEFQVSRRRLEARREAAVGGGGPRVLLVSEGEVTLHWQAGGEHGQETLARGQSVLIPDCLPALSLSCSHPAEVYEAEVPLA